jgi:ketosteroid isomerase-like protein
MKRYFSMSTLVLVTVIAGLLQLGCANPQPTNTSTNANMAVAEATPDKAAIEAELTRIENDWPRIIKEHDAAAVRRMEADDVVIVYPDGTLGGKDQDLKDIESGALTADSWEVSEVAIKVLDKDSAIATVRSVVKGGKYKMPDGKTNDISGEYRSVDTFVRRNEQWQVIGSATVPVRVPSSAAMTSPAPKASPSMKPSPTAKTSPAMKSMSPPPPTKTP